MLNSSTSVTARQIIPQALATSATHQFESARPQRIPADIPTHARAALRTHFDFSRIDESAFRSSTAQSAIIQHDDRAQKIDPYVWRSLYFQSKAISRIFILRNLASHLFGDATSPQQVVEFGSAGSLAPALAFPLAISFGVDNRPTMFANEFNYIPPEVWQSMGLPAQVAYHGHFRAGSARAKAHSFISHLIVNYERVAADIRSTPLPSGQTDLVVVFDSPTLLSRESTQEAARLLKPGGYLIRITSEVVACSKGGKVSSFYDTSRFRGWWEEIKVPYHTPESSDGFSRIKCPLPIRSWESLVRWRAHNRKPYEFGYTVEIFQRLQSRAKASN